MEKLFNIQNTPLTVPLQTRPAASKASNEKDAQMRKVAKDFETLFLNHMMKTMRSTIQKSDLSGSGMEQDMFTGMLDEEVSRLASEGSGVGLADMIYQQLSRKYGTDGRMPEMPIPAGIPEYAPVRNYAPEKTGMSGMDKVNRFADIIDEAARRYQIDPALIRSVILHESGGNPHAVSSKGARGLMQLMSGTARDMGVENAYDPQQNIHGGARYLRYLLDRYEGNVHLALSSYNAGPGTVDRYRGIPPYAETRRYVSRVLQTAAGLEAQASGQEE